MANRARLTAPRAAREDWPWHKVESSSLSASLLFSGDRRLEAESYLAEGFKIRLSIEAKHEGWACFGELTQTWQPNRLKGTIVSRDHGAPFLAATQVFDLRPTPRKWLALSQISDVNALYVEPGSILVTRSGTVGRATLARETLRGVLISDDLLRVEPNADSDWGWIYAFLRSSHAIKMLQAAHYGHVIKHLETSHLDSIPILLTTDTQKEHFQSQADTIISDRNRAEVLATQAEALLAQGFALPVRDNEEIAFWSMNARELFSGRRRLEASFHAPHVRTLLETITQSAVTVEQLVNLVNGVWWMTRFRRYFGEEGVPYRSSDDLFAISQVSEKRVFTDPIPNERDFFVQEGWILMACSGQIYGLNGSVTLATAHDENFFFSHDLIRIAPQPNQIRSGYLFAYLGHPQIGQILVKRNAYGSSVPHIDPGDVERIPVARLTPDQENEIADLAEEASRLQAEASHIEREIGREADELIAEFLS